jgi:hypothetical protein
MQVDSNVLNSKAFVGSSGISAEIDDTFSSVTVQQADGKTRFAIDPDVLDFIEHPACVQYRETLFLAFVRAFPHSFDSCIQDAKQHAAQHAQAGMLLDYECMPPERYLRRMTV